MTDPKASDDSTPTAAGRPVLVERNDGWAHVILNRPHRKNAITGPMLDLLTEAVEDLSADDSIGGIVLTGAGGAFCSGIDLTEIQADPQPAWVPEFSQTVRATHIALYNCACPIVVGLERYGINAGTALAAAGDLIIAGRSSFLQIGEIRQGAGIPMNAAWLRLKYDEKTLARLAFVGDRVMVDDLFRLGMVDEVVDDESVLDRAVEHGERLASYGAAATRRIKASIRAQATIDPETWFVAHHGPALLTAEQIRS